MVAQIHLEDMDMEIIQVQVVIEIATMADTQITLEVMAINKILVTLKTFSEYLDLIQEDKNKADIIRTSTKKKMCI